MYSNIGISPDGDFYTEDDNIPYCDCTLLNYEEEDYE